MTHGRHDLSNAVLLQLTCDTLVSVDFALQFDPLQLVLQDQLVRLTDVFGSCRLGQQIVLQARKRRDVMSHDMIFFFYVSPGTEVSKCPQTSSLISRRIDGCSSIRLNKVPTMQHCSAVCRSHSLLMSTADPGRKKVRTG